MDIRILVNSRHLPESFRGYGQYARQLLHALNVHGRKFTYTFVTPSLPSDLSAPIVSERAVVRTLPFGRLPTRVLRVAHWERVLFPRLVNSLRPDLVHNLAPGLVPRLLGTPTVTTVHDAIDEPRLRARRQPLRWLHLRLVHRMIRASDALCTVSHSARDEIASALGLNASRIAVIPPGASERHPEEDKRSPTLPQRLGELSGRKYVLYVGSDLPHKNVGRLIAAFRDARLEQHGWTLVLCGRDFRASPTSANCHGVAHVGYVTEAEKHALYANAGALALPSLAEGFGLPVLEALAAGCPVVASDIPVVREVAGECAVFCDASSVHSLSAALHRVTGDSVLSERLRSLGPARARRFQWQSSVASPESLYERTVAAGGSLR